MQPDRISTKAARMTRRAALAAACALALPGMARAEVSTVRVATQYGLAYLPLVIMEHDHLWETHAKRRGIDLTVDYRRLGGGSGLNDALLSGSVEVAAGGLAPMLAVWDKTTTSLRVKGLSAINAAPMDILTNRPDVRTLADLKPEDRIAVPAIRVSFQALALAAAARQEFGETGIGRLDSQTVAMQHPEALAALLSPSPQIAAYVSSSPFQERALRRNGIRKITDSFEAFGGPATFAVAYAKEAFAEDNPGVVAAYYDALVEAIARIARDRAGAVDAYLRTTGDGADRTLLIEILERPDFRFGETPSGTVTIAALMRKAHLMKNVVSDWKAFFVKPLHDKPGS
jgi:NitT/TauT family transport system substrate-binding protein